MKSIRLTRKNGQWRQIGHQWVLGIITPLISPHTKVSILQDLPKRRDMVNRQVTANHPPIPRFVLIASKTSGTI